MNNYLDRFPFMAIARGITPQEACPCTDVLVSAGFGIVEIPLNSPDPYESISNIVEKFGDRALIGAGTVFSVEQVEQVAAIGAKLIVSPHFDEELVKASKRLGLYCAPGVVTPTEAKAALSAGADALKLFPAEIITPDAVKALRAVLPPETLLIPVGGIGPDNWQTYFRAGSNGFGLGSSLYKKGATTGQLEKKAKAFQKSWDDWRQGQG